MSHSRRGVSNLRADAVQEFPGPRLAAMDWKTLPRRLTEFAERSRSALQCRWEGRANSSEWTGFLERPGCDPHEFHFNNGFFEPMDAEAAHVLVRSRNPLRTRERGCGYSTLLTDLKLFCPSLDEQRVWPCSFWMERKAAG